MFFDTKHVEAAYNLASAAHALQTRIDGGAYIEHPERVCNLVGEESKVVALLHDVLEDNPNARLVASPGISPYWKLCLGLDYVNLHTKEAEALLILTRSKEESYAEFIDRICESENSIALDVKLADLEDNLDDLPEKLESNRNKYEKAFAKLFDKHRNTVTA